MRTEMIEEDQAPIVPDVRSRNRRGIQDEQEVDGESIKEDIEALRMEAPFVPMIAKRRSLRLKKVRKLQETDD